MTPLVIDVIPHDRKRAGKSSPANRALLHQADIQPHLNL